ncbi:response regulator [Acrocarpospora catenulata]|uniref:response regulator n=1 Tax=Acrocarpospora catenulata TaxID=2836182 RepID=UPI001BDA6817|nr:response regulator [Acrocarpospora catenulata]
MDSVGGQHRPTRILVVDDEPQLLRALRINLAARHYAVAVAADGAGALRHAADWHPDLIVLDLGLPDMDGVEVIHGLRGWTNVPIIVLSGRGGSADKVGALDAGADDYLTKPFGIDELLARIRAVTRRTTTTAESAVIQLGSHTIDLTNKTISGNIRLTPTEWHLLEILLRNPGKLVSQRQLLTDVWGPTYQKESHYLRQYLAQLRRKLEPDPAHPKHLLTEPGMGYRFQP